MTIATYITGGLGPGATIAYFIVRGFDIGAAIVLPEVLIADVSLPAEDTIAVMMDDSVVLGPEDSVVVLRG